MGHHLIDGEFQSDKYPETPRGLVPLKPSDPLAQDLLWEYAQRRREIDAEFADDLEEALRAKGYQPADASWTEIRRYASDEGYSDETAPVLEVFFGGNLDWYVAIEFTDHENRYADSCRRRVAVRVTTSGSRIAGLAKAVKGLWDLLKHEESFCDRHEEWLRWSLTRGIPRKLERS